MKLLNTDNIDTVADDKKLDWCLIQGWCFIKSLSTVPKHENYVFQWCVTIASLSNTLRAHDVTSNLVKFVLSEFVRTLQKGLCNLSNTDSADRFLFEKTFHFKNFYCFRL